MAELGNFWGLIDFFDFFGAFFPLSRAFQKYFRWKRLCISNFARSITLKTATNFKKVIKFSKKLKKKSQKSMRPQKWRSWTTFTPMLYTVRCTFVCCYRISQFFFFSNAWVSACLTVCVYARLLPFLSKNFCLGGWDDAFSRSNSLTSSWDCHSSFTVINLLAKIEL